MRKALLLTLVVLACAVCTVSAQGVRVVSGPGTMQAVTHTKPTDKTGNGTATLKMNGLACAITPARDGTVVFLVTGTVANPTAIADGANLQLAYGTGTAPSNAGVATGTVLSALQKFITATTLEKVPFSIAAAVSGLTVGTAYWFDLQVQDVTGGTATITDVDCTAIEI